MLLCSTQRNALILLNAPETRESIIKNIIDWVEDNKQSASSILWLHGPAGAGNFATETIAQNCKDNGLIVSHFFSRTSSSSERSDGDRVIPTLTQRLLQAFPVTKQYVKDVIHRDSGIFDCVQYRWSFTSTSPDLQFFVTSKLERYDQHPHVT